MLPGTSIAVSLNVHQILIDRTIKYRSLHLYRELRVENCLPHVLFSWLEREPLLCCTAETYHPRLVAPDAEPSCEWLVAERRHICRMQETDNSNTIYSNSTMVATD
jgi:hypothetical protein